MIVSWTDPQPSVQYDYAQVYRATSNSFGAASLLVDTRANTYTDTTAVSGVTYYYWVRSRQGAEFSTEVATTPTNSTAAAINAATATNVEWSGVLDGAGTIPSNNATVGGTLGLDIKDEGGTTIGDIDSLNKHALGALQAANFNPYMTLVDPDRDTPMGWYVGDQTGSGTHAQILEYTNANKNILKMNSGYGATLVSQAMRIIPGMDLMGIIRYDLSGASSIKFPVFALDAEDLGADYLTICTTPTNADPEVLAATREVGVTLSAIGSTTWTTAVMALRRPDVTGTFLSTHTPNAEWCSVGVVLTSAVDIEIDYIYLWWQPSTYFSFGAP
jgi:hypothetical protein